MAVSTVDLTPAVNAEVNETIARDGNWTRKGYITMVWVFIIILIIVIIIAIIVAATTSSSSNVVSAAAGGGFLAGFLGILLLLIVAYPLSKVLTIVIGIILVLWVIIALIGWIVAISRNSATTPATNMALPGVVGAT